MHTQLEKCADVRNHGHNNMGCLDVGNTSSWWGMSAQEHTFIFSNLSVLMVGTVIYLLALWIYYNCSL